MKLTDICDFQGGSQPPKNEWSLEARDGYIRMLQIRDFTQSEKVIPEYVKIDNSTKICEKDDILIARYGASIGKILTGLAGAYNVAIMRTIPNENKINKKYLYYYLKSHYFQSAILNVGSRAAQAGFNKDDLSKLEIKCLTLLEQDRIVNVLEKVEAIVEKRKQELRDLDNLIKARFVELTEQTKTIPTRMGDIASYINGYAFKPTDWKEVGKPIIRIQNLNDVLAKYNYYDGELADKYKVSFGDVLISWATHLEAYIWEGGDAWLNQHIFKVLFDKMEVDKTYFVYATEEALRQAFKNAHGFKPTMEHIKRSDFENAIVKLPVLEVQRQFADFVTQVNKSKIVCLEILQKTAKFSCINPFL